MGPPAASTEADLPRLISGAEGVITGTVVCAAVIAAGAAKAASTGHLVLVTLGTVLVYWLAHVHARALANAITDRRHPLTAVRHAFGHTWPIPGASVLPIGILLVAELVGAELRSASWVAVIATVGLLAGYSYLAGRRGGLGVWGSVTCAVAGAGLGALIAVLKAVA